MSSETNRTSLFTPEQEKMYDEMAELSRFHRTEMNKYDQRLKYYRDWKNVIRDAGAIDPHPFTEAEEKEFEEIAKASQAHFQEAMKYEQSLKYYRDLKNVVATAYEDGIAAGRRKWEREKMEGRREADIAFVRNALRKNMSVSDIARLTELSEEEVNALR